MANTHFKIIKIGPINFLGKHKKTTTHLKQSTLRLGICIDPQKLLACDNDCKLLFKEF